MLRRGSQLVFVVSMLVIAICAWNEAAEGAAARAEKEMENLLLRLLTAEPDIDHPIELAALRAAAADIAADCFGPLAPASIQPLLLAHSLHRVLDRLAGNSSAILIAGQLVYLLGANKSHAPHDYAWALIQAAEIGENEYATLSKSPADERPLWRSHRQFALALLDIADLLDGDRPIAALYFQRASINRTHPDVQENRNSKLAQARIRRVAADLETLRHCPDADSFHLAGLMLGSVVEELQGNDRNTDALRRATLTPAIATALPPAAKPAAPEFDLPLPPAVSEGESTPLPEDCPEPPASPAVFE